MEQQRRLKQRTRLRFFDTKNTQDQLKKFNEVLHELNHLKVELIVITVTKKKGQGCENWDKCDHFYSGVPKQNRVYRD